jgi:hypothetical protein
MAYQKIVAAVERSEIAERLVPPLIPKTVSPMWNVRFENRPGIAHAGASRGVGPS